MEKTVYFRSFEIEDAKLIHQWKNDDSLHEYSFGLNKRTCYQEDEDWVRARMKHNPYEAWWAICSVATNEIIGYAALTKIHFINSSAFYSGILIGNKDYNDGFAWIETYLFVLEYAFERLGLNRLYGECLLAHKDSSMIGPLLFFTREGILRETVYKNGKYYDSCINSILKREYFEHKQNGDYEFRAILKRIRALKKKTE